MRFVGLVALAAVLGSVAAVAPPGSHSFIGAGGLVRLKYPAGLMPGRMFKGRSLMPAGWRLVWDGADPGYGKSVVRFSQVARPDDGIGQVTEMVQVGISRDSRVVADCGTRGLASATAVRLRDRMLDRHRWTVYRYGDAGMSQRVAAIDYRTVVDGVCYAIDRISYTVVAAPSPPRNTPSRAVVAARMDAILASVRVGRSR